MGVECPFCHNLIEEVYYCPACKLANPPVLIELKFLSGVGPMGTLECPQCKKGWRTNPFGLMEVRDEVGRYAPKKKGDPK